MADFSGDIKIETFFKVLDCYRIALINQERAYKNRVRVSEFRSKQQQKAWDTVFAINYLSHIHQLVFSYLDHLRKLNTKASWKVLETIEENLHFDPNENLFGFIIALTNLIEHEGQTLQQPIENHYFMLNLIAKASEYTLLVMTPFPIIFIPALLPAIACCIALCIGAYVLHSISNDLVEKGSKLNPLVEKLKDARAAVYQEVFSYTFQERNPHTGRLTRIVQVNKSQEALPSGLLETFFFKKLKPDTYTPSFAVAKDFEAEISAACKA